MDMDIILIMTSYKCYKENYLLYKCGNIPARAGFFSLIQLIESLIRNKILFKKNIYYIIYLIKNKKFLFITFYNLF